MSDSSKVVCVQGCRPGTIRAASHHPTAHLALAQWHKVVQPAAVAESEIDLLKYPHKYPQYQWEAIARENAILREGLDRFEVAIDGRPYKDPRIDMSRPLGLTSIPRRLAIIEQRASMLKHYSTRLSATLDEAWKAGFRYYH